MTGFQTILNDFAVRRGKGAGLLAAWNSGTSHIRSAEIMVKLCNSGMLYTEVGCTDLVLFWDCAGDEG